jgi:hypothetical protein
MKVKTNVRGGALPAGGIIDDFYIPRSLLCPRRYP